MLTPEAELAPLAEKIALPVALNALALFTLMMEEVIASAITRWPSSV